MAAVVDEVQHAGAAFGYGKPGLICCPERAVGLTDLGRDAGEPAKHLLVEQRRARRPRHDAPHDRPVVEAFCGELAVGEDGGLVIAEPVELALAVRVFTPDSLCFDSVDREGLGQVEGMLHVDQNTSVFWRWQRANHSRTIWPLRSGVLTVFSSSPVAQSPARDFTLSSEVLVRIL